MMLFPFYFLIFIFEVFSLEHYVNIYCMRNFILVSVCGIKLPTEIISYTGLKTWYNGIEIYFSLAEIWLWPLPR